jgi:acetyl esterase/lipase
MKRGCLLLLCSLLLGSGFVSAQVKPTKVEVEPRKESVHPQEFKNLKYLSVAGRDEFLDVYQNPSSDPRPVVVYFHGGAWWKGNRPETYGSFRSFLAMGFSVVSVDYRLTGVATAPAAVQDTRCALSWVKKNAKKYNFDPSRVVAYGTSAGGHLALMAGMAPSLWDVDLPECKDQPNVAAILDFYGIADIAVLLQGAKLTNSAGRWIGDGPNRVELAKQMSPMTYVHKGNPPVFLVHGDADPVVPYEQAVRLQKALDEAGVPNKFFTVPGGHHGQFDEAQKQEIMKSIREFLIGQKVLDAK